MLYRSSCLTIFYFFHIKRERSQVEDSSKNNYFIFIIKSAIRYLQRKPITASDIALKGDSHYNKDIMLIPILVILLTTAYCGSSPIRLITCGGTIDRAYTDQNGNYMFNESFIPIMCKQSRSEENITIQHLMAKDSLYMTDADRQIVLKEVQKAEETRIIITHGTDSIVNTSIVLGENIKDKTVVLIGAIIPYNEPESDALFNLGFAVSSVQLLPHGVYVCMQGVVFDWFNVRKNRDLMKFQVLNKEEQL